MELSKIYSELLECFAYFDEHYNDFETRDKAVEQILRANEALRELQDIVDNYNVIMELKTK